LFILFYNRAWLQHWQLYAAAIFSLLLFTPVIAWNVQHNFITYIFHSKRVDVSAASGLHLDGLLTFIAGQIAYCNPIVFALVAYALFQRHYGIKKFQKKILLLAAVPLIVVANVLAMFKDLLPHWTGPALPSLLLLTATYFATQKNATSKKQMPLALKVAAGLLGFVLLAGMLVVNYLPGTLGSRKAERLGEDDFTLDMYGWHQLKNQFDSIRKNNNKIYPKTKEVILVHKWFPAAHIDYYIGQPLGLTTYAVGEPNQIHQYNWLNAQRSLPADSVGIYVISPSNYPVMPSQFDALKQIAPTHTDSFVQHRSGKPVRNVWVYYFKKGQYHLK
jgi:4-amino-4-deoxy-L-arabinose transferase-like glycosyltransferase